LLKDSRMSKLVAALLIMLERFHNYLDDSTKLFSDLQLPKFLVISAKSFFRCVSSVALLYIDRDFTDALYSKIKRSLKKRKQIIRY